MPVSQVWAEFRTTESKADGNTLKGRALGCCWALPWAKRPSQGGTGGDTLPLTSSALSVGAMKTMNGESSAVRTILRVCGERGAVSRVWPFPRQGPGTAGWLLSPTTPHAAPSQAGTVPVMQWGLKETPLTGDMSSLGGLLENGPCNPLPQQPGRGPAVTASCVL